MTGDAHVPIVQPALTRRGFLALGGYATVLVCVGCRRDGAAPPALAFLTEAEYATVAAVCDRLLPPDGDPGAIDLGVPDYIDRALAGDQARWRTRVRTGLAALDAAARQRTGTAYAAASPMAQDNLLDDWQDGAPEQAELVRVLFTLTLEGAFGDPSHGGNRDGRGWHLIGFAPCEPRHHAHHAQHT